MSRSKTSTAARKPSAVVVGGPDLAKMRRPPVHPGEILDTEFLTARKVSKSDAARAMGMSLNRLSEIILGKRGMTPETCVLVGALTGTSAEMWDRLNGDHYLWHAMQTTDTKHVAPLKKAS